MEPNLKISHSSQDFTSLDNLIHLISDFYQNGNDLSNLENTSSIQLALNEFYNDVKDYKEAVKEIKQVQSGIINVEQLEGICCRPNKIQRLDSFNAKKYALLTPEPVLSEKTGEEQQSSKSETLIRKATSSEALKSWLSVSNVHVVQTSFSQGSSTTATTSRGHERLRKSIIKGEFAKVTLTAHPELIEFVNCETNKTYQKYVTLQNTDTKPVRFEIAARPARSAFTVFIESPTKGDLAPGMQVRLVVRYRALVLGAEPEESLVIRVRGGRQVGLRLRVRRDAPRLKGLTQNFSSMFFNERLSESTATSSDLYYTSTSSSTDQQDSYSSYYSTESSDSLLPHALSTFDCNKCFVGEFVYVSTTLKNVGGKGRFFIMSEIDWCSYKLEDVTYKNSLIIPPFAISPAYFALQPDEQLTLNTYFFPDTSGLQVDELYFISDNCGVKTFEIIGDGILFETQSLQFDKKIKYQWFHTDDKQICTVRYIDLGTGDSKDTLAASFEVISKCELSVRYQWKVSDLVLYPPNYKNTVSRKPISPDNVYIEPTNGIFEAGTSTKFTVLIDLGPELIPDRYRTTLQLVIEDIPLAAIPKKCNFTYEDTKMKQRLCDNPVDIFFENIEIRATCRSPKSNEDLNASCSDIKCQVDTVISMLFTDETMLDSEKSDLDVIESSTSSSSNEVCRLIKGLGTCDCCRTELISKAVVRPPGPLFVGVEHTFLISITNTSSKQLKYWWSSATGADHTKMKVSIYPRFDYIQPNEFHAIKIKCLPLESGDISSLFVPCQCNAISPALVLSIECTVKGLLVAFYYPLTTEKNIRVEWAADEYVSKYDTKTEQIKLFKIKLKSEKLLFSSTLNSLSSDGKKDSSSGKESYENDSEMSGSEEIVNSCKDNANEDLLSPESTEESWDYEGEEDYEEEHNELIPYFNFDAYMIEQHFRYQPMIVEFYVTSGKKTTKRFCLQNESPIRSRFRIINKNLWKESRNSTLSEPNDLLSGLTLNIEPMEGQIRPYETIFFDVVATSNTWGIYTDQIIIKIDLLPFHSFWVRIINENLPISYPICKNSKSKIPKIRFSVYKVGCESGVRKLLVENTSDIPLYVNWHCFLIDDDVKPKPFSLILDMLTPFMGVDEFLAMNKSLYDAVKKFFSCAFNPYKSDKNVVPTADTEKVSSSECIFTYLSQESTQLQLMNIELPSNTTTAPSSGNKFKDSEFQLSIVPYYGILNYDLFVIKPSELFLPPKEKRYISITVNTKYLDQRLNKVSCKACGFIRIPPIFKYKDNVYFRKDGHYLPPTEIHLECDVKKPLLSVLSTKEQRTFVIHVNTFIQEKKKEIEMNKSIFLTNCNEEILTAVFEIHEPFRIKRISTEKYVFWKNKGSVNPGESIKITINCKINENWIKSKYDYNSKSDNIANYVTVQDKLLIIYKEGFTQSVSLLVKLVLPSLKLSTNHLFFEKCLVGETKTLSFTIHNLLDKPQCFEIQREEANRVFTFFPKKALLASRFAKEINSEQIYVSFNSKQKGHFKESVNIIAIEDGLVTTCTFEGSS